MKYLGSGLVLLVSLAITAGGDVLLIEGEQYRHGDSLVIGADAVLAPTDTGATFTLDGVPAAPQASTWGEGAHTLNLSSPNDPAEPTNLRVVVDLSAPELSWRSGDLDALAQSHGADYDIGGKGDADLKLADGAPDQVEWSSDGKVWSPVTWGIPPGHASTDPQGGVLLASWIVQSHRPQVFLRRAEKGQAKALFGEGAPIPLDQENEVLLVSVEDRWSAVAMLRLSVVQWGDLQRLVIEAEDVVGNGTRLEWPLLD